MAGTGSLPGYQGLQGHVEDKMDILGRGKSGELHLGTSVKIHRTLYPLGVNFAE